MRALCIVMLIATAQAAAFSMAKVPSTTSPKYPSSFPSIIASGVSRSRKASASPPMRSNTSLELSPASAAGLLLRGGAAEAVVLKNFYGDALGFFGGIRIPATFFAGSSLAAIFTLKGAASSLEDGSKLTKLERRVVKFYHLTSVLAFLLSLNTVVTATSAHTSVLHGRFDPMAETAYMLMRTEFLYEFVSVRWSFLMSIFCFLGMVASRVLIEFGLLKECDETRKDVAKLTVFSIGALAAHLLSYVNEKLWCWRSLIGMTAYLARLVVKRAFVEKRPLQMVSILCTLASAYYVGKLTVEDIKESSN